MATVIGALQLWGLYALGLFVFWNIYWNFSLFSIMYFLYSKTPFGPYYHKKLLRKTRGKPPHRKAKTVDCGSYVVRTVAYLSDNYAYIIEDKNTHKCAVVDPADPARVMEEFGKHCSERKIGNAATLSMVLTTHHHMDHAGGNKQLKSKLPDLQIYGGRKDRVAGATQQCEDGAVITLGDTTIKVLEVPCHTKGHVIFHVLPGAGRTSRGSLFTGDSVFVAGCGKFFEGNGAQFARIAMDVLPKLVGDTYVFCGHEYTIDNAAFASFVEPNNAKLKTLVATAAAAKEAGEPTVPTTLDQERETNPFLRLDKPAVRAICGAHTSSPNGLVANILRSLKDRKMHLQTHEVEDDRGKKWL